MDELEEARKKEREKDRKREALRLKREEELKKKFIRTGIIAAAVLVCVVLGVVSAVRYSKAKEAAAAAEKKKQQEAALAKEQEENIIDFLAVGDNIAHLGMRESGMKESGDWNRDDISGYPSFGTPPEFGDALVDTGFDVVVHATNHILDKGTDSIEYTMKWWKEKHPEIPILGIHQDQEDAEHITVVQCKALKLAMLDYTYGLNDIPLAEDKSYMVDVFDQEKARADIRKAREEADVVIVVMHVGEEYVQDVDEQTRKWVDLFLEEDVDIVIGSHPHVIRTMETLTGEDGHKMLVYYSLGNFTSTQNDLPSLLGAMAKITIKKDVKTGAIQIPEHEFIPLLMHYNHDSRTYGIYKLNDYTQELADQHTANERNPGEFSISYYKELFEQIKAKGNDDEI